MRLNWKPLIPIVMCMLAACIGSTRKVLSTYEKVVVIGDGIDSLKGYLSRPAGASASPALIVLAGVDRLTPPVQHVANDLATVGFVALAVDYDPDRTAESSSLVREVAGKSLAERVSEAVDWLTQQGFVDKNRIGAIGWGSGTDLVLQMAERGRIVAGVVSEEESGTGQKQRPDSNTVPVMRCKGRVDSDLTRVRQFLHSYLDTPRVIDRPVSAAADDPVIRVADIMRSVMSEDGIRGRIARSIASTPKTTEQWERVRSDAALLAESGNLLFGLRPAKGSVIGWQQRSAEFRDAALALVDATKQRNLQAARNVLGQLPRTCAACHADYR